MSNIRLLDVSVDGDTAEGELRLLIDGKHVKHLDIGPDIYSAKDVCFEPILITVLPPIPSGDWKFARITRDETSRQIVCTPDPVAKLDEITSTWHPKYIEYLDIEIIGELRSPLKIARHPSFQQRFVLKTARFPWEIARHDDETRAYSWVVGQDFAPAFLAHVTEHGRVIGFVMEEIADARHAAPGDLVSCRETLQRLHRLGVRHGDINRHNFLIKDDKAFLIDFERAQRCDDPGVLEEELQALDKALSDTSSKGGMRVEVV